MSGQAGAGNGAPDHSGRIDPDKAGIDLVFPRPPQRATH
jgi:hypothetical protein